jgi:hypothetical protein
VVVGRLQLAVATLKQAIPSAVPATKATAKVEVSDGAGAELGCFEADVQVGH